MEHAKQALGYHPIQPVFKQKLGLYSEYINIGSASFNSGIYYYSFYADEESSKGISVLPDGCLDIIICCHSDAPSADICGSTISLKQATFIRPNCEYFGIRFLPGYAEQFLKHPLQLFTENEIPIREVIPHAEELLALILSRTSFVERIAVFEQFFKRYIGGELEIPSFVQYVSDKIITSHGAVSVRDLTLDTSYSARYLSKLFERYMGTSPKLFSRIVRFQYIVKALEQQHYAQIINELIELGYYDQNHFIKEFKQFCLTTPKQYMKHSYTSINPPKKSQLTGI